MAMNGAGFVPEQPNKGREGQAEESLEALGGAVTKHHAGEKEPQTLEQAALLAQTQGQNVQGSQGAQGAGRQEGPHHGPHLGFLLI